MPDSEGRGVGRAARDGSVRESSARKIPAHKSPSTSAATTNNGQPTFGKRGFGLRETGIGRGAGGGGDGGGGGMRGGAGVNIVAAGSGTRDAVAGAVEIFGAGTAIDPNIPCARFRNQRSKTEKSCVLSGRRGMEIARRIASVLRPEEVS